MQRLRAIEQDWSTINDMRQDFESTKAKLKTLMHRELVPQTETMPSTSRAPHVDRTVHAYNPTCAAVGNPQAYTQHHQPGVADSGLSIDTDELEGSRRVNDGHRMAGTVSEECSKPYSQWHRYEQRLRAREAEAEAAELRSEVRYTSTGSPADAFFQCCDVGAQLKSCFIAFHTFEQPKVTLNLEAERQ